MPSLSDAFRNVPLKFKVEPDINAMKEVPELYVWPREEEDHVPAAVQDDGNGNGVGVPVIDMKGGLGSVVEMVRAACEESAVFQIVNHGVPQELLKRMEECAHRLFSLPLERKMLAQRPPDGVTGYGIPRIGKFFKKLMWSEGFTCIDSPLEHAKKLWPHNYQEFCEVVEEYDRAMKKLASRLMSVILQTLGVRASNYRWWCEDGHGRGRLGEERCCGAVQMNHYPRSPLPSQTMGLPAHTDSTLLTILYQGSVEGLEIKRHDGTWMLVPPLPNAFVVNIGDLLQVLSNGRYRSVVHRAVNNSKARLSIAYLWGPPVNAEIEPPAELVDSKHPRLYKSLTWQEYLVARAKHFNEALRLFAYVQ